MQYYAHKTQSFSSLMRSMHSHAAAINVRILTGKFIFHIYLHMEERVCVHLQDKKTKLAEFLSTHIEKY